MCDWCGGEVRDNEPRIESGDYPTVWHEGCADENVSSIQNGVHFGGQP